VAQKVSGYRSISNAATIGSDWDLASSGLVSYAVDHGWCKSAEDFHFARCYSDFLYTRLSDASRRQSCTSRCLAEKSGGIQVHDAMQFLRMHGEESADTLHLDRSLLGASVCMHASAGPVRNSQSVGSLVAHLTDLRPTIWVTGTSAPCTSIFKPVWVDSGVPLAEPSPEGTYDERCLWWRHEKLHRAVLRNYQQRSAAYSADRNDLEAQFITQAGQCGDSVEMRREFSKACFQTAGAAEARWMEQVLAIPEGKPRVYYRSAWRQFDQQAKID
jgi:dipeptidase